MYMGALNVLCLLIFISALPVFFLYLWFRLSRFSLPLHWFLLFLLAGLFSLLIALVLQRLLPDIPPGSGETGRVLYTVFCKVALAEETGRLLVFLAFFRLTASSLLRFAHKTPKNRQSGDFSPCKLPKEPDNRDFYDTKWRKNPPVQQAPGFSAPGFWGALAGLVAGLGFAAIENASYGAADMGIAFIRAFTTAPLHGACGARVGAAAADLRETPLPALLRFLSAVAIHGMYDFMILLRGVPWVLAILAAFSALASSILFIRAGFSRAAE